MKRIFIISLALIMALSICGCEKKDNAAISVSADVKNGGEVIENELSVFSYKPDTFCPVLSNNEANLRMLNIIYDGLISLDDELVPVPELAEKWSVSDDGLEWTIGLRNDVLWHDGEAFDASDVEYTVNEIKKHSESAYYYNVSSIASVSRVNANTIKILLSEPSPNFINLLYFPIIKNNSVGEDIAAFQPIGTGAFIFEDRKEGNIYYLVRNENWWGGKVKSECIKVKMLPDKDTALYAFSSGSIDLTGAEGMDWGKFVDPTASAYVDFQTPIYNFVGINHQNEVLKMNEVRAAVSHAIDRQEIVDEALMGYGKVSIAPIRAEWSMCENKNVKHVRNTKTAQKKLLDNGWETSSNGYRKKVNEKSYELSFEILINEENTVRENIAKIVKKNLEEFGIKISVTKVPYEKYAERISSGDYDMFIGSYSISPDLKFDFMLGEGNIFAYYDEEMAIVTESLKRRKNEELLTSYTEFINLFEQTNPVIGLCFENSVMIYTSRVQGNIIPSYFDWYRGIEKLYKGADKK